MSGKYAPPPRFANGRKAPNLGETLLPVEQIYRAASSLSWKELEQRFRGIQDRLPEQERVSAEFTQAEWESGSKTDVWTVRGESASRTEFERLATIGSRKIGYAGREEATTYWLESVWKWLHEAGLDRAKDLTWRTSIEGHEEGIFYKNSRVILHSISQPSALFCVELMARGALESVASMPIERGIGSQGSRSSRAGMPRKPTKAQLHRTQTIFGAIQLGLKAHRYCAALDERKVRPLGQWIEEGCPPSYAQAYKEAKWQKRIQDEKSRYRKQYDDTSIQKIEKIIQG